MLWQARARRDAMMISVGVQVLMAAVLMAVAITFCIESFQQDFSLAVDGITQPLTRSFAVLLTAASSIGLSISSIRQWLRTPVSESAKIVDDAASGAIRQKLGFMHIIKKELDRLGQVLQGERRVPNFLDYLLPTALLNGHIHSLLLWLLGLSQHKQDFQPCRMVIYVDDLDRCPTEKVMEVLQSLVLLTEGTPFIILLAIDQRVIVTAIENSGEGLFNDAGVNGHEYLDKIVQIPFVIPQLADDEKAKLCKGYLTPWRPQRPQIRVPRQWRDSVWVAYQRPDNLPDFALLILEPPQQKLELSATNKYSWADATEEQERALYRATWRLFQSGLGEALCGVLREKSHPHLLPYIGGNVPLNYYLKHNFKAPAPIPSNDLDIKVEFGTHMRALLAERGGGPSSADKESWSEEEKAQFQACFDESLAMFVTYAKELMEALRAAAEAVLEKITSELKPLGIGIGPQAVHVYHKTHAAPRGDNPPLHLVPLSGGVFQLMCELTPPGGGEPFIWNLVDLEADWKSAKVDGKAFPTVTVPQP